MEHFIIGGLALIDLWAALPPAILMKTDPLLTSIVVGLASSVGVVITVYLCSVFRAWVMQQLKSLFTIKSRDLVVNWP